MIELDKPGQKGIIRAEAYKVSGDGLMVTLREISDESGHMLFLVSQWDIKGQYGPTVLTTAKPDYAYQIFMIWAFGA
jgi:hypothetical protein